MFKSWYFVLDHRWKNERFEVGLSRLNLHINKDAYNQILKLTGGKIPERVRTSQIQFLTYDYDDITSSTIGLFDDEIQFAYIPIPLLPEDKDQNLITFFSLRPSDVTDSDICIPAVDDGMQIDQASWSQIIRFCDVTMS